MIIGGGRQASPSATTSDRKGGPSSSSTRNERAATRGASAGPLFDSIPRPPQTVSRAWHSPRPHTTSRPVSRWPTTSSPTRSDSSYRSEGASRWKRSSGTATATSQRPAIVGSAQKTPSSRPASSSTSARSFPSSRSDLDPAIRQLHSADYRGPDQVQPGSVLVVGAAHSGGDIAYELARAGYSTILSGRDTGQSPVRHRQSNSARGCPVLRFVATRVLTVDADRSQGAAGDSLTRRAAPPRQARRSQGCGRGARLRPNSRRRRR